jgi:o-succinylbenzoate synthase
MRAEVIPYRLPLKRPWVAARTTLNERIGALLKLADADGLTGWGDCAPLPSNNNADVVLAALEDWACRPAGADFSNMPPEVRWAIETAEADLAAQRAGLPLWRHLGGTTNKIAINAALGPLDDGLSARLAAVVAAGCRIGKIKVGGAPVEEEIARLNDLPVTLRLRLDANRAWSDQDALRFLTAIAELPIDGVEEPLAAPTPAKLAALQAAVSYPLAIDESLQQLGSETLIATQAVRRIVLKPARLGGIAATRAVARAARAAGIEVVLTSVVDSTVGVTAAAHLAAAIAPGIVHGLGTSDWLAADVAPPPPIIAGWLQLSDRPGLGTNPV